MDENHFNKSVMRPIYHNNEAMADWIVEVLWSKNLVMSINLAGICNSDDTDTCCGLKVADWTLGLPQAVRAIL